MPQQQIVFDAEGLLKLLTHYTEEAIPLDGILVSAGVSSMFSSWIGLEVESKEWDGVVLADGGINPLHIRYDGKRICSWGNDRHEKAEWKYRSERGLSE